MRALCGAIISAGALVGLGLVCVGMGIRYENVNYHDANGTTVEYVKFGQMDTALTMAFVVLIIALLVGLGIAFVGLAYHHHRRGWEMHRAHGGLPGATPPATGTSERLSV